MRELTHPRPDAEAVPGTLVTLASFGPVGVVLGTAGDRLIVELAVSGTPVRPVTSLDELAVTR